MDISLSSINPGNSENTFRASWLNRKRISAIISSMVWRRKGEMPNADKMMLDAAVKFFKAQTIPDSRLCFELGDRYILKFGKAIKDERSVTIWAREQNRILVHVAFTSGGTAKQMIVFEDADIVCYQLSDIPELSDDAIAGLWVETPPDLPKS